MGDRAHSVRLAWMTTVVVFSALLLYPACGGGGGGTKPRPPSPTDLKVNTTALPDALVGVAYNQALSASGGKPPYTWSLKQDSPPLPTGLTLSSAGVLQGIPENYGASYMTELKVVVRDSDSQSAQGGVSLIVSRRMEIDDRSLPKGNVGVNYETILWGTLGYGNHTWSLTGDSGPLPPGLELVSPGGGGAGVIKGTPTASGTFSFVVQVKDSGNPGQTATRAFTIVVENRVVIITTALPFAVVGLPYQEGMTAVGGTPPYTWTVISGNLPQGLGLNASTGAITGTPTIEGAQGVTFDVTDSSSQPQKDSRQIYCYVRPPLGFITERFGDGIKDTLLHEYPQVGGGRPPFFLRVAEGALPKNMNLESGTSYDGWFHLVGVPTELGTSTFTLEVTDSYDPPSKVSKPLSIQINTRLSITTTSLPNGLTGDQYGATLTATGGVPPYTWYVPYEPLPKGLTLDTSKGEINGVPTEPYWDDFVIGVEDSSHGPQWASNSYTVRIVGRLAITSGRLPPGRPQTPYRVQLGIFGGTAPYMWTITSGNLPSGLTLGASTGQITGTPSAEGTSNFTVQVTDAGPPVQTVSKALSLTIASNLGRNDDPATATPISNGTFRASISPYADPVEGPANPDHDFYELTANPGSVVTVETTATRLVPASPIDTVVEIVDAAGGRLSTCRIYAYETYSQPCLNDDNPQVTSTDSRLEFQVPASETGPVTFYVHVFSWDGNARPDYVYELTVYGAN